MGIKNHIWEAKQVGNYKEIFYSLNIFPYTIEIYKLGLKCVYFVSLLVSKD